MAYIVKYNGEYLFDPYTSDDAIYDVKLSAEVNAAAYFDFSIPCTHHLYDKIAERDGIVRVYSDKKLLFIGEITEISDDFNQNKTVSCVDPRDHLDDVMIRPYSTVEGEEPLLAPSSIDGYFQWLVDQYNNGMINAKFHFQVGVNQGGSLTKSNYIYKKNEGLPGVGSEIENEILDAYGGYLVLTYPEEIPTLNLYADVHEANTQIIDFGANLIDFTRTSSTTDQYTAVRPVGGTPEKTDDDPGNYQPKPVTIEELGDGVTFVDSDYVKKGDIVYSVSKVNRYGYREYNWTESDTLDANTLLEEAIADLKKQVEPKITIDVKAVDLALFMEDYDHLECGEVARIRSNPHGVDEYLLVSSMDINLQDPSQTSYTLGRAYDSLTGEQSAYVKLLNSGINSSLDAVAGLDQTVKDQATKVDQAVTDAGNALDTANDAKDTANTAKDTADNAQQAADAAQDTADAAKDTANTAKDTADNAQKLVQNIQQTVIRIDQDLEETSNKAQDAYDKADQLAGTIETVQTDIQGLEGEVDGLTVTVTGAAEDASSALKQVAQTQTDLSGFKTSVSQTYSTKTELEDAITQEVADRNAAIQVGIDGISSTVSSNYTELTEKVNAAQSDADDALAAAQTASEDLAEFTGTITGEISDLQSQIDGSIQTWFYNGVPTISNPPAEDWTTNDLKNNHLGDLYYDLDTGYAYRFMVQNGIYSWSRLADSDVTTALQNAAKAQDTADNKRRVFVTTPTPPYDVGDLWVQGANGDIKRCQTAKTSSQSYAAADWVLASKYTDDTKADHVESDLNSYKTTVSNTYATKSSLTQTSEEILAEVSQTYSTKTETSDAIAQEVLDRNSAISQSASQIQSTVSQTYSTKTEASAIEDKADAAQSTANTANSNASKAQTAASNAQNTANAANSAADAAQDDLDAYKTTVSNTYATKSSLTQTANEIRAEVSESYQVKGDYATSDDLDDAIAQEVLDRNSAISQSATQIQQTVSQIYTTKQEASEIEDTANAANAAANAAQSDLDAYKTTVSNTYATKSSVTQTANSIKSEVAAEYTTKTEFEGLEIGGRNLLRWHDIENIGSTTSGSGTDDFTGHYWASPAMSNAVAIDVLEPSTQYTISFTVEIVDISDAAEGVTSPYDTQTGFLFYSPSTPTNNLNARFVNFGSSKTIGETRSVSRTITTPGEIPNDYRILMYTRMWKAATATDTFRFTNVKIEKGNKATDWSPAPEDMASTDYVQTTYATKSSLEQTENSITASVESKYLSKTDASSTYATKTQLEQTEDSITTTVSQVQTIADNAYAKASQVEQTAEGLQVTLTEVEATANSAKSTATTANNTANSAKSTATAAQNTANAAKKQVYHSAHGTEGTAGYVRFATVKFTGPYLNRPVFFALSNRGEMQSNVWVQWTNSNSSDPSLASFLADGGINVWAHKTATSTWEIIARKSEGYDTIYVNDYSNNNGSGCAVSWVNVQLSSVPSGSTQATRLAGKRSSADIDNAAKTATNYLKFDSSGLVIGTNSSGTGQSGLQSNVLLDSASVNIRKGTTVLSTFAANLIEIGKNAMSSIIRLCGNALEISAETLSNGDTNANIAVNPSSDSTGNGILNLYSSNVGHARSGIRLSENNIDLLANYVYVDGKLHANLDPALLWSGTLSRGGTITVPDLEKYSLFAVFFDGGYAYHPLLAVKDSIADDRPDTNSSICGVTGLWLPEDTRSYYVMYMELGITEYANRVTLKGAAFRRSRPNGTDWDPVEVNVRRIYGIS